MSIQLYGSFSGYDSFGRVSRELAFALYRRHLDVSLMGIDVGVGQFIESYVDVPPFPLGLVDNTAPVGIAIGYPEKGYMWLRGHKHRILMTVCESDAIPNAWVEPCNRVSMVVVPSHFCKEVFQRCGVRVPVEVVPHGVSSEFCLQTAVEYGDTTAFHMLDVTPADLGIGPSLKPRLLHVTGAAGYPARKGTPQVLIAAKQLEDVFDLTLLTSAPPIGAIKELGFKIQNTPLIKTFASLTDKELANLYYSHDAILQPSRGEGFGLTPLEAKCCGTPAIYTNVSGHKEHFDKETDIEVEVGNPNWMPTTGNEAGGAPTLTVKAVRHAIQKFLGSQAFYNDAVCKWQAKNASKWRWDVILAPFISALRPLLVGSELRLGGRSGLKGIEEG